MIPKITRRQLVIKLYIITIPSFFSQIIGHIKWEGSNAWCPNYFRVEIITKSHHKYNYYVTREWTKYVRNASIYRTCQQKSSTHQNGIKLLFLSIHNFVLHQQANNAHLLLKFVAASQQLVRLTWIGKKNKFKGISNYIMITAWTDDQFHL